MFLCTTGDPYSLFSKPSFYILLTWAGALPDRGRIRSHKRVAALCSVLKNIWKWDTLRKLSKELLSKLTKTEHHQCASVRSPILHLVLYLAHALTTSEGDLCQKKENWLIFKLGHSLESREMILNRNVNVIVKYDLRHCCVTF